MNNDETFKLVSALIVSLGFEIEVVRDYNERKEHPDVAMKYNQGKPYQGRVLKVSGMQNALDRDEDGYYTSYLVKPEISYKVT